MLDRNKRFSPDYPTARSRFLEATSGLPSGSIPVPGSGPSGEFLSIDWAWSGDPAAEAVLVISSGLHGIEGYAGSAVQLELLASNPAIPTLWVHALNPYGMAHRRRVNANNVDLNRNFLPPGDSYSGCDPNYTLLNPLLNPPDPPGLDAFWLKVGLVLLQKGFKSLKNAVACGQYDYPRGLFYGGDRLQPEAEAALALFIEKLAGKKRIVHLDLHTALGAYGDCTPVLEGDPSSEQLSRAKAVFGEKLRSWSKDDADGYIIRGGMTKELARRLSEVRYDGFTCEFGTRSNLAVLGAMREETRQHFYSRLQPLESQETSVKKRFINAYIPQDTAWMDKVIAHAAPLYQKGGALLAS
jgi:hypothetical protein